MIKDLLTASASSRFLVAKESSGGTLRLVLMLDKAFCICVVLLLNPEITARGGLAEGGVAGGDVVEDDVARSGEKDLSDISVEVSSLSENATKIYFKLCYTKLWKDLILAIFISSRARFINMDEFQLNASELASGDIKNFVGAFDL